MKRLDLTDGEILALRADGQCAIRRPALPLAAIPRFHVRSDLPHVNGILCAQAGVEYQVELNPHGAVTAVIDRKRLGLKPREFDFVCPLAEGRTYLDGCWHIDVLIGDFAFGADDRGRVISVVLDQLGGEWQWRAEAVCS